MNINSLSKKIREEGIAGSSLYYLGRFLSKAELRIVGKWAQKHCKVSDRIVFKNRQNQDFTDNARALFEYLIRNHYNDKYQIIYMVSDKKSFRDKKFRTPEYKNVKFVTAENRYGWNSPAAYYYGATAKYFFYTNHNADLNRYYCDGQVTVNLWHGCGYKGSTLDKKDIPHSDTMGRFDYALVPGPVFVDTKAAYWHCDKEKFFLWVIPDMTGCFIRLRISAAYFKSFLTGKMEEKQLSGCLLSEKAISRGTEKMKLNCRLNFLH